MLWFDSADHFPLARSLQIKIIIKKNIYVQMYYVYVAISNQTVQIHFSKMEETFKSINNPVGSVKTAVNKVKNTQKLKQKNL